MVLYGEGVVFGMALDDIPGATIREKRAWLYTSLAADLRPVVAKGWAAAMTDEAVVLIPSGHMVVTVGDAMSGYRWSVSSDQSDQARVKDVLSMLLASFRELAQPSVGYQNYLNYLEEV